MTVRLSQPFYALQPLADALQLVRRHGAVIADFDPSGASGGNPELLLDFKTEEAALAFMREHNPDDDDAFNRSRLQKI